MTPAARASAKRTCRKGVAFLYAVIFLGMVATVGTLIAASLMLQAKQTTRVLHDTQLREILRHGGDLALTRPAPGRREVPLPGELSDAGFSLVVQDTGDGNVTVEARSPGGKRVLRSHMVIPTTDGQLRSVTLSPG